MLAVAIVLFGVTRAAQGDAVERLRLEKLRATHAAVEALTGQRQPVSLGNGFDDCRALVHVHSAFSHDSRGTLAEIASAARAVGARVVMFSEHPAPHYDYFRDGHRGTVDGVLMIPGAETGGFLAWPRRSIQQEPTGAPQEFADLVARDGGLAFVSHLEERMDWDIAGAAGMEIYNTHADVKDETAFLALLRTPLGLFQIAPAFDQYPQEAFAALLDYPADYLARYDALCQKARLTGVAANDAHHNQGFRVHVDDHGALVIDDALGKRVAAIDPKKIPLVGPLVAGKKPGDTVFALDLDPYERSFRHVSTHLLVNDVSEAGVRDALGAGRAYVAFDWIADPTGFVYQARCGDVTEPMGREIELVPGLRLEAESPLSGRFRLLRDGQVVVDQVTRAIDVPVETPGVYRLEIWQTLAGESRPWILSNPIYVRPPSTKKP